MTREGEIFSQVRSKSRPVLLAGKQTEVVFGERVSRVSEFSEVRRNSQRFVLLKVPQINRE